jgi:hypothetical protein
MIESRFYCKDCHTGFNAKQNYEYHIKTKKHKNRLSNNENLHICLKCQKKFTYISGLSRHRLTCKYNSPILVELQKENDELRKEIEQLKIQLKQMSVHSDFQNLLSMNKEKYL